MRITRKPWYVSWCMMRQRCEDPKHPAFKWYGGRGITVCERWRSSANFLLDMGVRPEGKQLDRIDPNGNYEPSNCRWATKKEQANNTRSNTIITAHGQSMTMTQWSEKTGIAVGTIWNRIRLGWSDEMCVSIPVGGRRIKRTHCKNGHALSADNIMVTPKGYIDCKTCRQKSSREYQRRRRTSIRSMSTGA